MLDPHTVQFLADHFDSEESLMLVLALREEQQVIPVAQLLDILRSRFGVQIDDVEARVAEKRLELRLGDLVKSGLVEKAAAGFRYAPGSDEVENRMKSIATEFRDHRREVNRIIYGGRSRARVLADAFNL